MPINLFPNCEIWSKEETSIIGELMGDTENVEISMGCGYRKWPSEVTFQKGWMAAAGTRQGVQGAVRFIAGRNYPLS